MPSLYTAIKPLMLLTPQVRLAVAGAFHTRFMEPAVSRLEAALAATEIRTPKIPVISNVDAQPHADPDRIKKILARQVFYLQLFLLHFELEILTAPDVEYYRYFPCSMGNNSEDSRNQGPEEGL